MCFFKYRENVVILFQNSRTFLKKGFLKNDSTLYKYNNNTQFTGRHTVYLQPKQLDSNISHAKITLIIL